MNTYSTDPLDNDSDDDDLDDGAEVNTHLTDPNDADSDEDGLGDGAEVNTYSTNPLLEDTSGDGLGDAVLVNAGFDPTVDYSNLVNASRQGMIDLRAGSTIIAVENGQATLIMEVEQSDDLELWRPFNFNIGGPFMPNPLDPNDGRYNLIRIDLPSFTDDEKSFYRFKFDD